MTFVGCGRRSFWLAFSQTLDGVASTKQNKNQMRLFEFKLGMNGS